MKYELINYTVSPERTVMQDVIVDGIVVSQEPTDTYDVTLTLNIHPTDDVAPDFSKTIDVNSSNSMTGFQVDEQRDLAVENYMIAINMV